jgi:hypothetical protein
MLILFPTVLFLFNWEFDVLFRLCLLKTKAESRFLEINIPRLSEQRLILGKAGGIK